VPREGLRRCIRRRWIFARCMCRSGASAPASGGGRAGRQFRHDQPAPAPAHGGSRLAVVLVLVDGATQTVLPGRTTHTSAGLARFHRAEGKGQGESARVSMRLLSAPSFPSRSLEQLELSTVPGEARAKCGGFVSGVSSPSPYGGAGRTRATRAPRSQLPSSPASWANGPLPASPS
jgi:hypothetical protein